MRRYTGSRTGVPWARTTVRIWGGPQIALFEAMCEATGRLPGRTRRRHRARRTDGSRV